jgi:hypothetical protein
MGRPPIEWPIPAYVVELRERLIVTFRVRTGLLARLLPAPLSPCIELGTGLIALGVGAGRCLKTVGGPPTLAHEFQVAELVTPVRWEPPCRDSAVGNYLLSAYTDSGSVRRFLRTAASVEPLRAALELKTARGELRCEVSLAGGSSAALRGIPESFEALVAPADSSPAVPEAVLLAPACYFLSDVRECVIRSVPVHQYARTTVPVQLEGAAALTHGVATAIGCGDDELIPDRMWYQKRCTHTWSFPPERIPVAMAPTPFRYDARDRMLAA